MQAKKIILSIICICSCFLSRGQKQVNSKQLQDFSVIAYYDGSVAQLDSFPTQHLTHIIFSFGLLRGRQLRITSAKDSAVIRKMVSLKEKNPQLKVILSLGGWGGCYTCSAVFDSTEGRTEFAKSVKNLLDYFGADGIDLDWEYPAIPGVPGHPYKTADKVNFTKLIQVLRTTLGTKPEISFAAGGFDAYIDSSIEWKLVSPLVDKINIMTYDLIHGYSKVSGHHTPLYSTSKQQLSCDNAIRLLMKKGVPKNKLVIGSAFYTRFFKTADTINNGLYRPCEFAYGVSHKNIKDSLSKGFNIYWDDVAKAPYAFNKERKIFATFDDKQSIRLKTLYARKNKLNGIMFWQMVDDSYKDGLLQTMFEASIK